MAQAKQPVVQSGGPQSPGLQEKLLHYWNYLPFPLSWIIVIFLILIVLTWLVTFLANL